MILRASLSEKEDISFGGFSDMFSNPRKGTLLQYTASSDSSGLSLEHTCRGQRWMLKKTDPPSKPAQWRLFLNWPSQDPSWACSYCRLLVHRQSWRRSWHSCRPSPAGPGEESAFSLLSGCAPSAPATKVIATNDSVRKADGQDAWIKGPSRERRTSGEGRSCSGWELRGLVRSLLPRMVQRCVAMTACCSTEQWFSRDRIRGYGDTCRKKIPGELNVCQAIKMQAQIKALQDLTV